MCDFLINNPEKIKLLIQEVSNIDAKIDKNGNTLLHCAVEGGSIEAVLSLLVNNADPNVHNSIEGETPLHVALTVKNREITELLIKYNADVTATNAFGESAMVYGPLLTEVIDELNENNRKFKDGYKPKGVFIWEELFKDEYSPLWSLILIALLINAFHNNALPPVHALPH